MKRNTTKQLTLSGVAMALSIVLGMLPIIRMPNGGSITLASMLPIIFVAVLTNTKWGILTAFSYSLIQIAREFYPPPTPNLLNFALVVALDYIIAFTILGFAGIFIKKIKNKAIAIGVGTCMVMSVRYLCSFLSGILIWGIYAPAGMPAWQYSLIYNGSYMIPEIILTTILAMLLYPFIVKITKHRFS